MKTNRVVLSAFAFVLAIGAALASTLHTTGYATNPFTSNCESQSIDSGCHTSTGTICQLTFTGPLGQTQSVDARENDCSGTILRKP